jgi:hypothetical protein
MHQAPLRALPSFLRVHTSLPEEAWEQGTPLRLPATEANSSLSVSQGHANPVGYNRLRARWHVSARSGLVQAVLTARSHKVIAWKKASKHSSQVGPWWQNCSNRQRRESEDQKGREKYHGPSQ